MQPIEFWFEFASTYSYPAAMRVESMAAAAGARVLWRPFLLGPIFQQQLGTADSPFNRNPARGRYMWRDLERICADDGLPLRKPTIFPRNALLAARVAHASEDQPWIGRFVRAVFHAKVPTRPSAETPSWSSTPPSRRVRSAHSP